MMDSIMRRSTQATSRPVPRALQFGPPSGPSRKGGHVYKYKDSGTSLSGKEEISITESIRYFAILNSESSTDHVMPSPWSPP